MTQIPPTPRRDPPDGDDPWRREGPSTGPRGAKSGGKRWLAFVAVAIGLTALLVWLSGRYPSALDSQDSMIDLVRWGAILVLVASGILASRRLTLGKAVRDLAIWAAVVAGLVAVYGFRSELTMVGGRILGELEPSRSQQRAGGELEFRRGGDGHFYIDAKVNGRPVRFLVDTGASDIVLSPADARRLGFRSSALTFNRVYETANGVGRGAPVVLDSVAVGAIRFREVSASVNDAAMSDSLLGLSFLDRLSGYEVRGDSLILRP
ncbi:MAG: TIGR02281 family clan AA aspartic protease [Alphaproteobacteria bacterium]|nr:TIGR02281 family clan AA aspartic protease [Alphaproteobacteria bacterium]